MFKCSRLVGIWEKMKLCSFVHERCTSLLALWLTFWQKHFTVLWHGLWHTLPLGKNIQALLHGLPLCKNIFQFCDTDYFLAKTFSSPVTWITSWQKHFWVLRHRLRHRLLHFKIIFQSCNTDCNTNYFLANTFSDLHRGPPQIIMQCHWQKPVYAEIDNALWVTK